MKIFNALSFLSTAHPVVVNLVYVYHDEVVHRRPVLTKNGEDIQTILTFFRFIFETSKMWKKNWETKNEDSKTVL